MKTSSSNSSYYIYFLDFIFIISLILSLFFGGRPRPRFAEATDDSFECSCFFFCLFRFISSLSYVSRGSLVSLISLASRCPIDRLPNAGDSRGFSDRVGVVLVYFSIGMWSPAFSNGIDYDLAGGARGTFFRLIISSMREEFSIFFVFEINCYGCPSRSESRDSTGAGGSYGGAFMTGCCVGDGCDGVIDLANWSGLDGLAWSEFCYKSEALLVSCSCLMSACKLVVSSAKCLRCSSRKKTWWEVCIFGRTVQDKGWRWTLRNLFS